MIVAASSFSRTLFQVLLISLVLWPGATLAQFSSADPYVEQPHPLTEEQGLARIKAQLEQEHTGEAIQLIERFLDQSDTPVFIEQFSFLYAIALEAEGQFNQAITTLEQFLEEFPGSTLVHEARLRLGTLYTEVQEPNRAVSILSRVLDLSSDDTLRAEALYRLCLAYESNGEYLRAIETALHHAEQSGADKRRDLLDYVRHLILEKMSEPSLSEVINAFPGASPGDLALIRLIEFHKSRDDETLAERDIRAFLQRFPDHPYVRTATALLRTVTAGIKAHRHVIAATLPFSGKMKPFGTETFNGIRLALEEDEAFGSSDAVGLVVKDSALPTARLRRDVSQLLDEFAPIALIGPLLAREVQLLADTPDFASVPFITPTATLPNVKQFGRYWFSSAMTPSLQINRLVEYAMRHFGYTRFCILAPQTPHGETLLHIFQQAAGQHGGEVIAAEWYQPGTTDASRQIIRMKETDLSLYGEMLPLAPEELTDPENAVVTEDDAPEDGNEEDVPLVYTPGFDALFLPGHPTDVAFLAAQLAFFDVNVPLLGTNTWNHPNLLTWGRSSIDGGLFGDALFLETTDPKTRRFITAYRERFQSDPSIFAVQAYDAMHVVLDAIRRGATTGPDVRIQLFVRHDLPALSGLEKFDEGGILTRKVYMIQIQNGRFVQLN
ncbi:MAG: ABC transporter substrate-binding protein [Nitrospira sp. SB0662_bin_26]|nr:ABC transporter substrate-binding protein [Nitrospira sp. SB0662_bin_26]